MANKSRPKKTRGLRYRKYVYGKKEEESKKRSSSSEEEDDIEMDVDEDADGSDGTRLGETMITQIHDLSGSTDEGRRYKLPLEVIYCIIAEYSAVKPMHLRINKTLFHLLAPIIYASPQLQSKNFFVFVETLSSSSRKKFYGPLVKNLDLSNIVQSGKNSYISRLLRRTAANLEVFIAPQTSFGYAPLVSLRGCRNLKTLDLGLVSETVNLSDLFVSMKNCPYLENLSFPRSSVECKDYEDIEWPHSLRNLRLSGGISKEFMDSAAFPNTIRTLEMAHCPFISAESIYTLLGKIGRHLRSLIIHYPMPKLKDDSMDMLLMYCPNLRFLYVSIDYVTEELLSEEYFDIHPLRNLWIDSSGSLGQSHKIHPDDITLALTDDRFPSLHTLKITHKLGWNTESDDIQNLITALEDQSGALYMSA